MKASLALCILLTAACSRAATPASGSSPASSASAPMAAPASTPSTSASTPSAKCQECVYNGRCQVIADGRNPLPCCDPVRSVLGDTDPAEVARCREAFEAAERARAKMPPCKTCMGKKKDGSPCMRLEAMGNADMRPCCDEVPVGAPTCE